MSPKQIAVVFLQGKEAVHGRSQLAAQIPVIQRRGQHHHVALPHSRINPVHIIPLDAGALPAAVASKTPSAAMDAQAAQEKFRNSMSRAFRTLREFLNQHGGVSVSPGGCRSK